MLVDPRGVRSELARAIARAEGFSARLGSARDLFASARIYFFRLESCYFLLPRENFSILCSMKKRGLLTSKKVLRIHTIKTPLMIQIFISRYFYGSQKPYY